MKSALVLIICSLFTSGVSFASLGGNEATVASDQSAISVGGNNSMIQHPKYRLHEMNHAGKRVREFVDANGTVFGLAWKGSAHPDLFLLLGDYFPDYKKAFEKNRTSRRGRAPIIFENDRVHIEVGGHMNAISGKVWIRKSLPAGLDTHEIQ